MSIKRTMFTVLLADFALDINAQAAENPGARAKPEVLFDGTSLDKFECDPDHWSISSDGAATARKGCGSAWSQRRYGDFILDLEFMVEKDSNSGVLLRVDGGKFYDNCLEIQVLDSHGAPRLTKGMCGALYDCLAPSGNAVNLPGQWNRFLITCQGPRVAVELNGKAIIDADLDQWTEVGKNPDGTNNVFKIAVKDKPREGIIGLQDHQDKVAYRNIKVKPLSPAKPADAKSAEPVVRDGWEILFDESVPDALRRDKNAWVVRDGALWFLGNPRPLKTKEAFGDFTLEFDFHLPKGGDGGLELRRQPPIYGNPFGGPTLVLRDPARQDAQGKRACGALWDCQEPSAQADVKLGEWNHCVVEWQDGKIRAAINGKQVLDADLGRWTQKGLNPDGSKNPFLHNPPLAEWPVEGPITFRGSVDYKNIKVIRR